MSPTPTATCPPSSPRTPWDWFHINAVHLDTDGNLLVSSRNTWTIFKVDRHTGQVMWQLGGKHSSFTLRAAPGQVLDHDGKIFAWQHDPEAIGGGKYTFFDDESGGNLLGSSRVVTVRLDLATRVATLVKSDDQPEGRVAQLMGNAQTTAGGDLFVGWGSLPYISEFSPSGRLLFNASSRSGSAPTAPTCCPGIRLADGARCQAVDDVVAKPKARVTDRRQYEQASMARDLAARGYVQLID